jgi:hypothetical protein
MKLVSSLSPPLNLMPCHKANPNGKFHIFVSKNPHQQNKNKIMDETPSLMQWFIFVIL